MSSRRPWSMSISLMSLARSEGQESTSVIRRLAKTTLPAPISAILGTLRDIASMIRLHFWGGAFKSRVSGFEFMCSTRNPLTRNWIEPVEAPGVLCPKSAPGRGGEMRGEQVERLHPTLVRCRIEHYRPVAAEGDANFAERV